MKNNLSQTTTEILKGDRLGSKFQSGEATSALISNGWFSLLLSVWLCSLSLGLFAWSSEVYEAFTSLPVMDQFAVVTAFAVFTLGFAATVREFRKDFAERWAARAMGVAGLGFLIAFTYHVSSQLDQAKSKLASKEMKLDSEASAVAHQISVVTAPKVYSVRTEGGIEISWNGTDGGAGPLSTSNRRGCFDHGATFAIDRTSSASGLRPGAVSAESSEPKPSAVSF